MTLTAFQSQRVRELEYINFNPRPDQPEKGDQQKSFFDSRLPGVTFMLGGNGCVAAEQEIYDPVMRVFRRIDSIDGDHHVFSIDENGTAVIAEANQPHPCSEENLYEVCLSNGETIRVTIAHRLLTDRGWKEVGDILCESHPSLFQKMNGESSHDYCQEIEKSWTGNNPASGKSDRYSVDPGCATLGSVDSSLDRSRRCVEETFFSSSHLPVGHCVFPSSSAECARSWLRTFEDSQIDYRRCNRFYDEQLRHGRGDDQVFPIPPVDAHEPYCWMPSLVSRVRKPVCIHPDQSNDHLSKNHYADQEHQLIEEGISSSSLCSQFSAQVDIPIQDATSNILASHLRTVFQKSPEGFHRHRTTASSDQTAKASCLGGQRLSGGVFASPCQPGEEQSQLSHQSDETPCQYDQSNMVAIQENQESRRSACKFSSLDTTESFFRLDKCGQVSTLNSPDEQPFPHSVKIISIRFLRRDIYWDFHVPKYENYWMGGVWNHNSGTTTLGLAKMVDFICHQQPPPRRDTPFWVIAKNYEQTMNVCWKEKLHQKGHLHPNDIDWDRVSWYRPNQDWPYKVPLKCKRAYPGRNWQISFKSYEQGRGAMMGESIGGFLFVEQFPWGLLEEVLRGCREYDFVGNKLAEFTPVDPSMSLELRDMEENGKIPEGWGVFRANTECALEFGHVTQQWYDTFFGMLPKATREVRQKGLWGAFEGAVYPEWNTNIHCLPGDWEVPAGWHHRRAVDFGWTMDHAFVCLWIAFDDTGRIVIYDEYWYAGTELGILDHWKEIEDRHYWPEQSPYYGTTYMDHDLDAIRTLNRINEWTNGEYNPPSMSLANKNVHEGIEVIHMLLKPTIATGGPDDPKQPRLRVVKDRCPNLCREMLNYRYPKRTNEGVNVQAPRQDPIKDDDHAVDAMRYGVFTELYLRGGTPTTIAHSHSTSESVQIESAKIKRRKRRPRPGDGRPFDF